MSNCIQNKTIRSMDRATGQGGSALIIALVFLLAMTLIGTTAMQGTSQQERMAGNYRDRMMAFQAAEGALSIGKSQNTLLMLPNPGAIAPTVANNTPVWWQTDIVPPLPCLAATPCQVQGYGDLATPPHYVIEKISTAVGGTGDSGVGFAGAVGGAGQQFMCRYTSRATGGTNSAEVILEETRSCS